MERRISDLSVQTKSLQLEADYTNKLLQKILSLNINPSITNTRDYLKVLKLQHESLELLLSLNASLEEFLVQKDVTNDSLEGRDAETVSQCEQINTPLTNIETEPLDIPATEETDNKEENSNVPAPEEVTDNIVTEDVEEINGEVEPVERIERVDKSPSVTSSILFKLETIDISQNFDENLNFTIQTPFQKKTSEVAFIKDPPEIEKGDEFMISHVVSPSKFYVFVVNQDTAQIDDLSSSLTAFYEKYAKVYPTKEDAKKSGNFCAVKVEGNWCRGEIINWNEETNSDQVQVFLVDYGNQTNVPYQNLRKLRARFCKLPKLVHRCKLTYLYPPGSTAENQLTSWCSNAVKLFVDALGDLNTNIFHTLYVNSKRNVTEIEFKNINETDESNCMGQFLIKEGIAVEIIHQPQDQIRIPSFVRSIKAVNGIPDEDLDDEALEAKTIADYFNHIYDEGEANTLNEAVMNYDPRDEAETCRRMDRTGRCYKGSLCKFRHVRLTDGFTMDKVPVYNKALATYPPLKVGEVISVWISYICNIQKFYVQIARDQCAEGTLKTLIDAMNTPDVARNYEYLKMTPALGEIVIVKHWNNYWYRGMVVDIVYYEQPKKVETTVFVVDFGDTLNVSMNDLRKISPSLLHLPFQANLCRFSNVRHNPKKSHQEETLHFEQKYLGRRLTAKVVANPGYLQLRLYDYGKDVGLKLLSEGCGEFEDEPMFPKDEYLLLE